MHFGDYGGVVEPTPIQDTFVTALADIEIEDGFARFVLCSRQHIAGEQALVVVAKVVIPIDKAVGMATRTLSVLARRTVMA
jgi:hypothetical protein